MAIDITKAFKKGIDIVFRVASQLVRDATYYRPVSFSASTGQVIIEGMAASVKALVAGYRPNELGTVVIQPGDDKLLIRAEELVDIPSPGAGDYVIEELSGKRRDVLAAEIDVNLRIKPASGLRVRTTHPRPRNSHVPFHHPLQSLVGEGDEKEHAHWSQHLRRNGWVIRTRKLVGENNPQNDSNTPASPAPMAR